MQNGTANHLVPTGTPGQYTVEVTGLGETTVSVSIAHGVAADDAGNPTLATTAPFTYPFDGIKPTPVITGDNTLTNARRSFEIDFGEPVLEFEAADLTVLQGTKHNFQDLGNGRFSVDIDGIPGEHPVYLLIFPNVARDLADNLCNGTSETFEYPFDDLKPSVQILGSKTLTNTTRTLTVQFTEDVSGFELTDIAVAGGVPGNLIPGAPAPTDVYTVDISGATGDHMVSVSIPEAVAVDAATNPNNATSEPFAYRFDNVRPTPAISGPSTITRATRQLTINFGETVDDFEVDDISVENGAAGNLQGGTNGLYLSLIHI